MPTLAGGGGGTYLGRGVLTLVGVTHLGCRGTYLGRGYLPWPGGYPPWPGGTYLGQGYPPWLRGTHLGRGGVPTLAGGYLPWPGGTYLGQGGTHLGQGVPTLARGYPPWLGVPTLVRGIYLGWGGVPTLAGGYLPWPGGYLPWSGGYPPWSGGGYLPPHPEMGYPPPPHCGQTENITSRRTTYAGGNKCLSEFLLHKRSVNTYISVFVLSFCAFANVTNCSDVLFSETALIVHDSDTFFIHKELHCRTRPIRRDVSRIVIVISILYQFQHKVCVFAV